MKENKFIVLIFACIFTNSSCLNSMVIYNFFKEPNTLSQNVNKNASLDSINNYKVLSIETISKRELVNFAKITGQYNNQYKKSLNKIKKVYLIKLEDDKACWKALISIERGLNRKLTKISQGNLYSFQTIPYYNTNWVCDHFIMTVKIEDIIIRIKTKGWITNIYTTPNLQGLYYVETNNAIKL